MEDKALIELYWARDEAAITETASRTAKKLQKIEIILAKRKKSCYYISVNPHSFGLPVGAARLAGGRRRLEVQT